jgi:DNA modification methylase
MSAMPTATLMQGDSRDVLRGLEDRSVDAVITDTPYEFKGGFMGQSWDADGSAFDHRLWEQVVRVAKPGAWVAAFGGRHSWHRLAVAMEDAGLIIDDTLMWLFTTGGVKNKHTKLKTAWEPIILAKVKPEGTIARNVETYGTGYLGVGETRIPYLDEDDLTATLAKNPGRDDGVTSGVYGTNRPQQLVNVEGRHPANVIVSEDVADLLGRDQRFFKVAKASKRERDAGLSLDAGIAHNPHTCVKPMDLMEWLVRLLAPPGSTVLDPFVGSGTTGCAAVHVGRSCIGIEREDIYVQTAELRTAYWSAQPRADLSVPTAIERTCS